VHQICIERNAVQGVTLADGAILPAEAIVANIDVTTVYQKLLPPHPSPQLARLTAIKPSCSGFILLLGVAGQHPQLAHHNIFFSKDYRREFDDIFRRDVPPDDPTIYVAITSKSDPQHAPAGCENWFVLVNAPPLGAGFDWTAQAVAYREKVLRRLANFGLDLRGKIKTEEMLTPADLARLTGAWRGALYGASPHSPLTAFRRPHNRAPGVRGLYFAGGTTHPGGGVPMVMLSGQVVAEMIAKDIHP
jgi:phytoene desaturase